MIQLGAQFTGIHFTILLQRHTAATADYYF